MRWRSGPNHIVQIVNGGMAVFTKKGALFDTTGKVLYGLMRTNAIFTGFGGPCEFRNSGDAVVRYDQLAQRWLYVLPVFQQDTAVAPIALGAGESSRTAMQPGEPGPRGLINAPRAAAGPAGGRRAGTRPRAEVPGPASGHRRRSNPVFDVLRRERDVRSARTVLSL